MIWILATTIIITELSFKPRLDATRDMKLLLWYGRNNRRYIQLY